VTTILITDCLVRLAPRHYTDDPLYLASSSFVPSELEMDLPCPRSRLRGTCRLIPRATGHNTTTITQRRRARPNCDHRYSEHDEKSGRAPFVGSTIVIAWTALIIAHRRAGLTASEDDRQCKCIHIRQASSAIRASRKSTFRLLIKSSSVCQDVEISSSERH